MCSSGQEAFAKQAKSLKHCEGFDIVVEKRLAGAPEQGNIMLYGNPG